MTDTQELYQKGLLIIAKEEGELEELYGSGLSASKAVADWSQWKASRINAMEDLLAELFDMRPDDVSIEVHITYENEVA